MVRESIERIEAVRVAFGSLLSTLRKSAAKASEVASYYRLHVRARIGDNESSVSKLSPFVQRPPPIRTLPNEERMAATCLAGARR